MRYSRYEHTIEVLTPQYPYTEHAHLPWDVMQESDMWAHTKAERVKELRATLDQCVALGYAMVWHKHDMTTRTSVETTFAPTADAAAQMPARNYRALVARYPHLAETDQ